VVLIAGIREEALKVLEESGQPVAVVLGIRIGNDLRKSGRLEVRKRIGSGVVHAVGSFLLPSCAQVWTARQQLQDRCVDAVVVHDASRLAMARFKTVSCRPMRTDEYRRGTPDALHRSHGLQDHVLSVQMPARPGTWCRTHHGPRAQYGFSFELTIRRSTILAPEIQKLIASGQIIPKFLP
jgi:hypothetical protein